MTALLALVLALQQTPAPATQGTAPGTPAPPATTAPPATAPKATPPPRTTGSHLVHPPGTGDRPDRDAGAGGCGQRGGSGEPGRSHRRERRGAVAHAWQRYLPDPGIERRVHHARERGRHSARGRDCAGRVLAVGSAASSASTTRAGTGEAAGPDLAGAGRQGW